MPGPTAKHLFKRSDSVNWRLRLSFPKSMHASHGRVKELSLGTPDKVEAMEKAGPMVAAHNRLIRIQRNFDGGVFWAPEGLKFPVGTHNFPDGAW
jgi:hypothetical protein